MSYGGRLVNAVRLGLTGFFDKREGPVRERRDHECDMSPVAIILKPVPGGWSVCLTDGRQLARFRGFGARARALRYLAGVSAGP